ncbi:MAG TPA: twin-arginine translocation signal domain-containing protein [Steroidobacteraceae bacterium]|nr:twin-arginine translocation signal domain-containing protein [Steroidobacteraceae bacterium]
MDTERRDFLKTTGLLTGMLAAGSPLALIAPSHVWAVELKALTSGEGATLLAVARTIAPHDKLDDAAYAVVIASIDADAAKSAATLAMLRAGLARLGTKFASEPEEERVRRLRVLESTEFFRAVRADTLGTLYSTPMAYAYFGYEGEAFSKGGYIYRGFNDLKWLPDVPPADSGPIAPEA